MSVVGAIDWAHRGESFTAPSSAIPAVTETTVDYTSFAGGIRWTYSESRQINPFAHALVGATYMRWGSSVNGQSMSGSSETHPIVSVGGGVAVPIGARIAAMVQADYRRILFEVFGVNSVRGVIGFRFAIR